jgi:hypothetical protein
VIDPKDGAGAQFVVGEDEVEEESEESRHWKQSQEPGLQLKPKYGLEAFEENVWSGGEPSEPPKENP